MSITPPTPPPIPAYQRSGYHDPENCCQGCLAIGPTRKVMFFQHVGALVMMFNRHIKGRLCRSCVNRHFAKTTLITSFFGWWGLISCILTPFFLLNNVVRYIFCMSLRPSDEGEVDGTGLALVAFVLAGGLLASLIFLIARIANS